MTLKLRSVLSCSPVTGLIAAVLLMVPLLQACSKQPSKRFTFTFATADGSAADVFLNGRNVGPAPYSWDIYPQAEFDPALSFSQWPPLPKDEIEDFKGGLLVRRDGKELHLRVAVAGGIRPEDAAAKLARRYPQLQPGEQLLFLKTDAGGAAPTKGVLRFRLVGADGTVYRYDPELGSDSSGYEILRIGCRKSK